MTRRPYLFAVATFLGCWLILAATAPGIPIVWDEGEYLRRAGLVTDWFRLLFDPSQSAGGRHAFSAEAIQAHWLFINYTEGHPAGFIIPIAFSRVMFEGVFDPLTAARLGSITVFSLACAWVAFRVREEWGSLAACVAPIALLTFPRIFSEAHFATQDGQLTAWWLMLWASDAALTRRPRAAAGTGVLLGLVTASKFTGWFAWVPVIASQIALRTRASMRNLAIILAVALVVFFVLNPPLWHQPIDGLMSHFHRSLDRAHTYSISTLFLGRMYDMRHPLPWYNTLVWLLLVTPLPTLALGAVGLWQCVKVRNHGSVTLVIHWATLMIIRALPGAPPHDGIRLFLPAFGFWCVFTGIGAQRIWTLARASSSRWRLQFVRAMLVASLLGLGINLARYYPQTLSHYNALAGGVRGAASLGMEPAYWWDALDKDVLNWLNEHTEPAAAVAFSSVSNMTELHAWHRLRPRDVDPAKEPFQWYVLQNRPGQFSDRDRALLRGAEPAYLKYAGRRREGEPVPADLRVPLIAIYSYEQYMHAR